MEPVTGLLKTEAAAGVLQKMEPAIAELLWMETVVGLLLEVKSATVEP